jgi:drug/metabolite transporter (DMT)-like permease
MDAKLIGILSALGSAISWAAGSILFMRIGQTVTPFGMTLGKGIVSLFLLGIVLSFTGFDSIAGGPLALLFLSGILGIAMGDTFFFAALQDLGPIMLIIFFMLGQILTALLAIFILGEIPSLQAWIGIVITLAGIAIVLWTKIINDEEKQATRIRGLILGLLSMLCMAFSTIIAKQALATVSTIGATFIRMAAGTLGMATFGYATKRLGGWLSPLIRDMKMMGFFITSVAVVTFGGFWLSLVSIKYIDVAIANTLGATEPLFVVPLSIFFLKERVTASTIAGTIVTVLGVMLICRS